MKQAGNSFDARPVAALRPLPHSHQYAADSGVVTALCAVFGPAGVAERVAIIGMQPFQKSVEIERLRHRETKQLTPFFSGPNFIPHKVPSPNAEVCRIASHHQPLLAFPKRGRSSYLHRPGLKKSRTILVLV
ncbi:MAG: hypothetical protein WCS70_15425 [Verrucomicrobiota bacterium]